MKMKAYISVIDDGKMITNVKEVTFRNDGGAENKLVNIYPDVTYQKWEGFGGALTEAAGYMYNKLSEPLKEEIVSSYFAEDKMGYSMLRMPIDSCDFSLGHYEAVSTDDASFESFNLERVKENIFPFLEDIIKEYGKSPQIMLTPWTPPAYMKDNNDRNHGGKIKEEYKMQWAEYICNYVCEYKKLGFDVKRISLQNEPKAVQPWDSCIYTAEEERDFLVNYMRPALSKYDLNDLEIFIWDHNKERAFEWARTIIDEETDELVTGIAFHWYSGDHFDAIKMIHERFPNKKLILSEACIEFSKFEKGNVLVNAQKYAHDIIGNMKAGMTGFYDWNLLLDETGGPNHVGNYCDAPFLYSESKKELQKRSIADYIWHFSHFIKPGDTLIGTTQYTDEIDVVAFKDDEGAIKVVLLNRYDKQQEVNLRMENEMIELTLPAMSIVTIV